VPDDFFLVTPLRTRVNRLSRKKLMR